ncbi:MAG TPA: hypothetical protein VMS64_18715 [Candidatus Methylomirabilis sp.]|nr:hypothetical protein [Candidatus Methylomirabilis sp.]
MPSALRAVLLLAAPVLAAACAASVPPAKTQLQVREFQTQTFDTADSQLVMKAMFNALQDEGYVVKNAVIQLGLMTATKEIDLAPGRSGPTGGELSSSIGGMVIFGPQDAPAYRKIEVRDFTGNITEFGEQTKVRVSVQRKILNNRGYVVEVNPIDDPVFYQDFFSRMAKSVYLQKERL